LTVSQGLYGGLLSGLETQRQISGLLDELHYDGLTLGCSPGEDVVFHGPTEKRAPEGHVTDEMRRPKFDYHLDESDPDLVRLRRKEDGSLVAAFSARGATKEGIVEAAKEDYRALIQEHADSLRRQQEDNKAE
jgi:hypothetical protein